MPFLCPTLEHVQCFANPLTATVTSLMPTASVANYTPAACQPTALKHCSTIPSNVLFQTLFLLLRVKLGVVPRRKREQQTSSRRSGHRTMASTFQWLHTVLWPRRWMSSTGSILNPCESSSSFSHWLVNLKSGMYLD